MKTEIRVNPSAAAAVFRGVVSAMHASGKFAAVEFVKKDGTLRKLRFIAAQRNKYEIKGSKSAETRAANNPHLINLIDFDAFLEALAEGNDETTARGKAFRSVNSNAVKRLAFDGQVWIFGAV